MHACILKDRQVRLSAEPWCLCCCCCCPWNRVFKEKKIAGRLTVGRFHETASGGERTKIDLLSSSRSVGKQPQNPAESFLPISTRNGEASNGHRPAHDLVRRRSSSVVRLKWNCGGRKPLVEPKTTRTTTYNVSVAMAKQHFGPFSSLLYAAKFTHTPHSLSPDTIEQTLQNSFAATFASQTIQSIKILTKHQYVFYIS